MKKVLIIGGLILAFVLVAILGKGEEPVYLEGKHIVELDIKDYGKITLELDADKAPITVTNFINLVNEKYYDGLKFHRIMEGFMMQGGDGKDVKTIKGEFESNGVKNDISHVRGVISMARTNEPNSASSQFFIVHEDSTFLDGEYAAFGHVIDGIEVVDKVCKDSKPIDDNGTIKSSEMPIINYIRVQNN